MLNATAQHNNIGMKIRDGPFSQYTTPATTFVVVQPTVLQTKTTTNEAITSIEETPEPSEETPASQTSAS
ncbi:1655_t:CDS:2 [Entrophospora sp. SA101]|nr:1655_t:CDS:2 [Entrophospora sp. SA101]CAJ0845818.1 17445_t:CDS:2 [Entrophospora sp. SA101]